MSPFDAAWRLLKGDLGQPFRGFKQNMAQNSPEQIQRDTNENRQSMNDGGFQQKLMTLDEAEQRSAGHISRQLSDNAMREALASFTPENYYHEGTDPDRRDGGPRSPPVSSANNSHGNMPFLHSQRSTYDDEDNVHYPDDSMNYDVGINPNAQFPEDETQQPLPKRDSPRGQQPLTQAPPPPNRFNRR